MEALVAVGLAANVLQFVQAAGSIAAEASRIKTSGAPSDIPGLKARAEQLINQASNIKSQLEASGAIKTSEDQHLFDCALACEVSGRQFVAYVDKFITQRSSSNPLRHAQASIKFHWSHKNLESFAEKLEQFRSALMLASILAFRSSSDGHNRKVMAFLEEMKEENLTKEVRFEDAVGRVQQMTEESGAKLDQIQEKLHEHITTIYILKTESVQKTETVLLGWLNFRQLVWRYEEIPHAYQTTFEWIFHPPRAADEWDDFEAYLSGTSTSGPYFIQGKAGSGKSTLMKFITNSSLTRQKLQDWSGSMDLLVVDFYFWNMGTPMQKSHVGMLRAILYNVLKQYPDLVPAVFPILYQSPAEFFREPMEEPTYAELKPALKLLLEKSSPFLKLCIFIDGIDELEGDHKNISEFLYSLAGENLKLVVSSRPINACLNAFRGCPSLKLQDLTKNDMEVFVRENLTRSPLMLDLATQFPQESQKIIMEIKKRAEGAFLWVTLVVKLLLKGLENGDSLQDLHYKLGSLPSDLKELYEKMFAKMTSEYKIQASKIFQLLHSWDTETDSAPLMTITLHFSNQGQEEAFRLPVAPLEKARFEWVEHHTAAYIRSRCCGLIETYVSDVRSPVPHGYCLPNASKIGYLHRTVAEFLHDHEIWDSVCQQTKSSGFDPFLDLAISNLSILKICEHFYDLEMFPCIERIFKFHKLANSSAIYSVERYLDTVDRIRSTQRVEYVQRGGQGALPLHIHWSEDLYRPWWNISDGFSQNVVVPSERIHQKQEAGSILTFAARIGLFSFLYKQDNLLKLPYFSRYALLWSALEGCTDAFSDFGESYLSDRSETVRLLLHCLMHGEGPGIDRFLWLYMDHLDYRGALSVAQVGGAHINQRGLRSFLESLVEMIPPHCPELELGPIESDSGLDSRTLVSDTDFSIESSDSEIATPDVFTTLRQQSRQTERRPGNRRLTPMRRYDQGTPSQGPQKDFDRYTNRSKIQKSKRHSTWRS